jgi:capsule assembly protein Wzi/PAP2 superfamily protein
LRRLRFSVFVLVLAAYTPLGRAQESAPQSSVTSTSVTKKREEDSNHSKFDIARNQKQENTSYSGNRLQPWLLKDILADQRAIWTSPRRLHFEDASWLVPLGGLTAGLFATDTEVVRHLSNSPNRLNRSRELSDYGAGSLVGLAGGFYFWGRITHDDHKRETGILSLEALFDSLAVSSTLQFATDRERPQRDNSNGGFWRGGSSFPSDHAAAAWAVAGVVAHEYPGPLTKLLAYGLASAVSGARVTGKNHFPSDVLVGSAIGWFAARQVYRAHHNPEVDGGVWPTFVEARQGEFEKLPPNVGSPYVPLDSWIYPAFDRLAALGYLDSDIKGMRPWTRLECGRLLQEAGDRMSEEASDPPEPSRLYRALENEFAGDLALLGGGTNRRLHLESIYTRITGITGEPLNDGYHFGNTIINDFGRPYAEGTNNITGFSGWVSDGPFVVYVRGEYQHAPSTPALPLSARQVASQVDSLEKGSVVPVAPGTPFPAVDQFRLLEGYVAMKLENWEVSFGKQSLWWGPGQGGPMMFSDNAEPIAMFRVNRVTPFKLPSILGLLGPMRTEFFLGQLSGYEFIQTPLGLTGQFGRSLDPQPFINGQRISFKPTPNLELGVSRTTNFAGAGHPFTFHTFVRSLFALGNAPAGSAAKPGDRRSGFDFSYRIPKLRNWLTFYGDGFTDDQISPIGYFDRSAWTGGIYLSHIPGVPKVDLRAEGVYTDNPLGGNLGHGFYYFNDTWRSGYRNRGNLIGSWIGREGQGAQVWTTYWLSPKNKLQLSYRHQKVSQEFIPDGGTLNDVGLHADFWLRKDLSVSSYVQYEKWLFPVISPGAQTNVTTSIQLTFWPRKRGN